MGPRVRGELALLTPMLFNRKRNGSRNAEEKDSGRITSVKVRWFITLGGPPRRLARVQPKGCLLFPDMN